MQNVVVVSHTVCAHVESHKKTLWDAGPHPCDGGVVDDLETRTFVSHESVLYLPSTEDQKTSEVDPQGEDHPPHTNMAEQTPTGHPKVPNSK